MKYSRIALLIALVCNVLCLKAQDEDPYKVIFNLQKEVANKDTQIKKLEDDLRKMTDGKNRADSLLKVEKAIGKSKEVKERIKTLEQENKELEEKLKASSGNVEQAVNRQAKESQSQIIQLTQQHSNDSTTIESLRKELADLTNFRKMWLTQLAESVNEKWLEKPFSQIKLTELEGDVKLYEEFASADKRIADASTKLKSLLTDCRIYDQGVKTINSPYDATQVKNMANSIKNLMSKTNDPEKKQELSLLYWQLDNYGITIEIFQDVINAVDKQIDVQAGHKAIWPLVKVVLEQQQDDITAVKKIPWLAKQYDLYQTELEKNCIAPNSVHDIIKNLQP